MSTSDAVFPPEDVVCHMVQATIEDLRIQEYFLGHVDGTLPIEYQQESDSVCQEAFTLQLNVGLYSTTLQNY